MANKKRTSGNTSLKVATNVTCDQCHYPIIGRLHSMEIDKKSKQMCDSCAAKSNAKHLCKWHTRSWEPDISI